MKFDFCDLIHGDCLAIQKQCTDYFRQQKQNLAGDASEASLDDGLIDSALMVWNNEDDRCQGFNEEFSCRWLQEIHCHGDRDQISFPHVVRQRGLTQQPGKVVLPEETDTLDKLMGESDTTNGITSWEPRVSLV